MKTTLFRAGIPNKQLRVRNSKYHIPACVRAFDWLHDLKISEEYQEFEFVRALLPEAIWKNYEVFGIEGLREQVLLDRATRKLKARWCKKRPAMFNADTKKKKG